MLVYPWQPYKRMRIARCRCSHSHCMYMYVAAPPTSTAACNRACSSPLHCRQLAVARQARQLAVTTPTSLHACSLQHSPSHCTACSSPSHAACKLQQPLPLHSLHAAFNSSSHCIQLAATSSSTISLIPSACAHGNNTGRYYNHSQKINDHH